ncbi:MAG TPA: TetR/AcrR family transcriptional regulator [Chthoniobacterales bacterium]
MPRLSRLESQTLTRERLLTSARQVFLRVGYVRATIDVIADEAGYSKGAVYSNFESKEAIFLELLQEKLGADVAGMRELLVAGTNVEQLISAIRDYFAAREDVLDFTAVAAEFLTQVGHSSPHAERTAGLYREQRRAIADLLEALFEKAGRTPPAPAAEMAAATVSMTLGLAIQRGADRDAIPAVLWGKAIETYVKAILAAAN